MKYVRVMDKNKLIEIKKIFKNLDNHRSILNSVNNRQSMYEKYCKKVKYDIMKREGNNMENKTIEELREEIEEKINEFAAEIIEDKNSEEQIKNMFNQISTQITAYKNTIKSTLERILQNEDRRGIKEIDPNYVYELLQYADTRTMTLNNLYKQYVEKKADFSSYESLKETYEKFGVTSKK